MTREPLFYLRDIVDSIEKIQRYCAGLSFEDFTSNDMIIDAVIRNLEVIGEAAARLPHSIYSAYPDIPWKEMRGMRNILIHEYFGVDLRIIWKTVKQSIPELHLLINEVVNDLK